MTKSTRNKHWLMFVDHLYIMISKYQMLCRTLTKIDNRNRFLIYIKYPEANGYYSTLFLTDRRHDGICYIVVLLYVLRLKTCKSMFIWNGVCPRGLTIAGRFYLKDPFKEYIVLYASIKLHSIGFRASLHGMFCGPLFYADLNVSPKLLPQRLAPSMQLESYP